jgi:hypothetical protein
MAIVSSALEYALYSHYHFNVNGITGLKEYALNMTMMITSNLISLYHVYRSLSRHYFGPLSNGATNICNSHLIWGCFL